MLDLSIIVPVYNVEKYLDSCIDSIEKIRNINFEIVLVNDGSTDKSLNIAENLVKKYKNIKLINQKNGGLSCARNTGLRKAQGKYISFIDSDDLICADKFEELYLETKKYNLDIGVGNHIRFINLEKIEKPQKLKYRNLEKENVKTGIEFFDFADKRGLFSPIVCEKIYKRNFLLEKNLFFKEGIIYEDVLFSHIVISKAQRVKYINSYFYLYRQRIGSIMNDGKEKENIHYYYYIIKELIEELKNIENKRLKRVPLALYYSLVKKYKMRNFEVEERMKQVKGLWFYKIRKQVQNYFIKSID